ncbi:FUSC family protein [Larsenimonas suaedae]|uniref:FUSC family protein n=1 Tax=Larsenimonas suaedae TaxID=1851019 RepID=A0ABU1GY41_9GAMM|nr:FUSC family protein [Larsenimonas suaedae]MCM2972930.1 FUSC family protein [Larsenimonas suaedae]MDR5896367.1 FUSC family protein [Larsenimonas suaedae]
MPPLLRLYLLPERAVLQFALKGVIAMALALFLAMEMNLERPYWALISAVFLQIRPQSGLVIEKGLCQIGGTLVGGAAGIAIMALFMQSPGIALMVLMVWLSLNAAGSALVRNFNLTYGFAISGATAALIVLLSLVYSNAPSSFSVFDTAVARVSEIALGATCATLVSMLLWPARVRDIITAHARTVVNSAFNCLEQQLSLEADPNTARQSVIDTIQAVVALDNDSSAMVYEGPAGAGRVRAANVLAQRTLTLVADIQILGRLMRHAPESMDGTTKEVLDELRCTFRAMRETSSEKEARDMAQTLRRRIQHIKQETTLTPLQQRVLHSMREMVAYSILMLQANKAIVNAERTKLKAPSLSTYRDLLLGLLTGLRTGVAFAIGTLVWVASGNSSAVLMMVLPVIFSIMFARFPAPAPMLKQVLVGALIAFPAALIFGNVLLAGAPRDFEMLMLIFGPPLFLGLMAIANAQTRAYGLGFCIIYTILTMPSNSMSFNIASTLNRGLVVVLGLVILWALFRMIGSPSVKIMRRRLISATADDLRHLWQREKEHSEHWFNGRMAERLQRLAGYDAHLPEERRNLLDLGLTGLNLGHVSMRLHSYLSEYDDPRLKAASRRWQRALALAYQKCAWGDVDDDFRKASEVLLAQMKGDDGISKDRLDLTEGLCRRLELTFKRHSEVIQKT